MHPLHETSSQVTGPDTDRLLETYHGHPADARRVLQVLSVICQPVNQTRLQQVLYLLGWTAQHGQSLSRSTVAPLCALLQDEGLILRERDQLRCHPDIIEVPAREAVDDGVFGEIARATQQVIQLPTRSAATRGGFVELRRLRIALYQNQDQEVLRQLGLDRAPYEPAAYSDIAMLIRVCTRPLDPPWFDRLPDAIKFQVLSALLTWSARFLHEQNRAYGLMEGSFPALATEHRTAAYALVEQRLHRGRWEGVEALLNGDDSARALTLLGWLRFLQGEHGMAIEYFEAAIEDTAA